MGFSCSTKCSKSRSSKFPQTLRTFGTKHWSFKNELNSFLNLKKLHDLEKLKTYLILVSIRCQIIPIKDQMKISLMCENLDILGI